MTRGVPFFISTLYRSSEISTSKISLVYEWQSLLSVPLTLLQRVCTFVLGITKKGIRCKIQVPDEQKYCHYHQWQDTCCPIVMDKKVKKPGFIYIYTYELMYNSLLCGKLEELDWLFVDDSILSPDKLARRKWIDDCQILCKIGMTTKPSVSTRLLQWQNTCKHTVVNLTPDKVELLCNRRDSEKSFSKMFQKLSIKSTKKTKNSIAERLLTYRDGGFYVDHRGKRPIEEIENAIHKLLWKKYGQGLIYCYGCDPSGKKRHKEWFRITIKELPWLLQTIDAICHGNDI